MNDMQKTTVDVHAGAGAFSAKGKKLGVFIISYNAERLIQDTLDRIPEDIWNAVEVVYVVDDCSTDETTDAAISYPRHQDKLQVFRNRTNRRYGGNQKFGYQYALDLGLDCVVMVHGDGQYAPELLPDMFRPLVEDDADVVIGSRMIKRKDALKGGMPKYKFVSNIFLTWLQNLLSGLRLSEFHSGYRGYSAKFLRRVPFWDNSDEWHFDTNILFQARQIKAKIVEFAIPTKYGDETCHVNGIVYGMNCVFSSFLYRFHRMGLLRLKPYDVSRPIDRRKVQDKFSSHSLIGQRLKKMKLDNTRVLDLGFGCAGIASLLKQEGARLDGVDKSAWAIEDCGYLFDNVYQADLNQIDDIPLDGQYEIILAADVLQFLVSPQDVLSRLKKRLVKSGVLVVILPNVVNIYTRIQILFGAFPLLHTGLLEEEALHFYTLKSMKTLLTRTGWVVEESDVSSLPFTQLFPFLTHKFWSPFLYFVRGCTVCLPGLFAYQGILVCRNPNGPELL